MALSEDMSAIPSLVGDAVEQLGKLVQNETQLAKAELSEKMSQAGRGVALIGGAAVFGIPAVVLLLMALALWLGQFDFSPAAAHLIASGVGAVLCVVLATIGMSYLRPHNLKPTVTIHEVGRDFAAAKDMAR